MRYKCDIKDEIYPFPSQCRHINLLLKQVTVGPVYPASRVSYDTATATSAMVAERSHKKDGQICAAISKKKRKKIIFLQK